MRESLASRPPHRQDPILDKTVLAAEEGAEGIGFATRLVAPGDDQEALSFLLGVGYQPTFARSSTRPKSALVFSGSANPCQPSVTRG